MPFGSFSAVFDEENVMKTYDEMEVRLPLCHSYLQRWVKVGHNYKARSANPQGRSPNGPLIAGWMGDSFGSYSANHKQNFLLHNR